MKKATREEMRSYVCGQCHVEYYFEPETTRVVFPWDKGLHPEQIYAYYTDKPKGFAGDWLHPDSHTQMLKAQWYWDFVAAENSMGFHNPSQVMNVLDQSIDLAHQAITTANLAAGTNC